MLTLFKSTEGSSFSDFILLSNKETDIYNDELARYTSKQPSNGGRDNRESTSDKRESERINKLQTSSGQLHGFEHNCNIGLFTKDMDLSAPLHEYTHVFDAEVKQINPALWRKGISIMQTECKDLWDAVANYKNYGKSKEWQVLL